MRFPKPHLPAIPEPWDPDKIRHLALWLGLGQQAVQPDSHCISPTLSLSLHRVKVVFGTTVHKGFAVGDCALGPRLAHCTPPSSPEKVGYCVDLEAPENEQLLWSGGRIGRLVWGILRSGDGVGSVWDWVGEDLDHIEMATVFTREGRERGERWIKENEWREEEKERRREAWKIHWQVW